MLIKKTGRSRIYTSQKKKKRNEKLEQKSETVKSVFGFVFTASKFFSAFKGFFHLRQNNVGKSETD